jgi:thioredoxin reductase/bacterioferritin-associated ferredoxin
MAEACDLLIVGAGPAGMRAAVEADARGLSVVVADEGADAGGQAYRGAASGPFAGTADLGRDHASGGRLIAAFEASRVRKLHRTAVYMVESDEGGGFLVGLAQARGEALLVKARSVLVATGAHERAVPVPGWTLPGVMTAGAAQTLLKSSALAPDGPIVMAGMGPLPYLLAAQYARLGVRIAAVLDMTPAGNAWRALPHLPSFLASPYVWKGLGLLMRTYRSTRVFWRATEIEAVGDGHLSAVRFRSGGRERELPAGVLLLHCGVVPQVNLTMACGAAHEWNGRRLAFEPVRDADGRSTVDGLFIAGDTGGVGGADAAEAEGAVAALAVVRRLRGGLFEDAAVLSAWRGRLRKALRGRAFLDVLHRPGEALLMPSDDVVVCRCEEVTAGEIREAVLRGAVGPNQAKAFTRAGMGPCQARMCGLTVNALIADQAGLAPEEVGYMRLRMPVKPITVAQMAKARMP